MKQLASGRSRRAWRAATAPTLAATSLLFFSSTHPVTASAQSAEAALQRAESAYNRITTLRAAFVQTIENPMLGGPEVSRGTLWMAPPDRFAMRFGDPAGDRIVADGEWLWAYTPSTVPGQVIRQPIPDAGALTPDLFRQFVHRPLARYEATYVRQDTVGGEPVDVVRLVPKGPMPFREAAIAISRGTGLLRRVFLIEESGQRRTLVLTEVHPGAAVPPSEVRFEVPDGVRVVTP